MPGFDSDVFDASAFDLGIMQASGGYPGYNVPLGLEHTFENPDDGTLRVLPSHFRAPDRIPNCIGWWEADNVRVAEGGSVSSWPNLVGTGNPLAQADPTKRPTLVREQTPNSLPVVRFDGSNDVLTAAQTYASAGKTVIVYGKRRGAQVGTPAIWGFSSTQALLDNGANWGWIQNQAGGTSNVLADPANFHILTIRADSTSSLTPRSDGTAASTIDPNDAIAATGSKTLAVGSRTDTGSAFGAFDVAAICTFDRALTNAELILVERFFATKYGVPAFHVARPEDYHDRQVLGNFSDSTDISGGYMQLSGSIDQEEFAAFPDHYVIGATWRVRDLTSGQYVNAGELLEPASSQGQTVLVADGWGKGAEANVGRFCILNRNLELWAPGDQDPHNYTNWERIPVELLGKRIRWRVGKHTSFKKNDDGFPSAGWSSCVVAWIPGEVIKYVGFDLDWNKHDDNYDLEVLRMTGPDGNGSVVQTISLGAGVNNHYDISIPGSSDQVMLRIKRPSNREEKNAPQRSFILDNVAVGCLSTDGDYTLTESFTEIFDRIDCDFTNIEASAKDVTPFDTGRATLAQIADELSILDSWGWRVWADAGTGKKLGEAGKFGRQTWAVTQLATPLNLLPTDRFNQVFFEYDYGGEQFVTKTVTATPNPFPAGFNKTFNLQWDDPPPEDIATVFAQAVADYLSKADVAGSGQLVEVEDIANPGVPLAPTVVRPGDQIVLNTEDNVKVTVGSARHSADGKVVDVEFTSGNPTLDRWLAQRTRLLNRGRGQAQATLGLIGMDEPKAPQNLDAAPYRIETKKGDKITYFYTEWDAVTETIDDDGTALAWYHVRYRPLFKGGAEDGTPVPDINGGAWRHEHIEQPKSSDDPNVDIPTHAILTEIKNPKAWKWEIQVRAEDVLGQMSEWSTSVIRSLNAPTMPSVSNVVLDIDPYFVEVRWDLPDDDDDSTLVHPDVAAIDVKISRNASMTPILAKSRQHSGEYARFRIDKAIAYGDEIHAQVRTIDVYGYSSVWHPPTPAHDHITRVDTPTGLTGTYDIVASGRFAKWRLKLTCNELTGWKDRIDYYAFQVQVSNDGSSWDALTHSVHRVSEEQDGNTVVGTVFKPVHYNRFYRARVGATDIRGRKSNFTAWTQFNFPADIPPLPPENVVASEGQGLVRVRWDTNADAQGRPTADAAVAYQVQWATDKNFSNIVEWDKNVTAGHHALSTKKYKVRYWARVRSIDSDGQLSAGWTEATADPVSPRKVVAGRTNSLTGDPDETSDVDWVTDDGYDLTTSTTNRAYTPTVVGNAVAVAQTDTVGAAIYDFEGQLSATPNRTDMGFVLKSNLTGTAQLIVRVEDNSTSPTANTPTVQLYKRISGVFTSLGTGLPLGAAIDPGWADGQRFRLKLTYDPSARTIRFDVDPDIRTLTSTVTLTIADNNLIVNGSYVGLFKNRATLDDDGNSRFERIDVTDLLDGSTAFYDEFDRPASSSSLGVATSGQTWIPITGVWGISADATGSAMSGYASQLPVFYAEDGTARLTGIANAAKKEFGEGGVNTDAISFTIDRPTRFMIWASANIMTNEGAISSPQQTEWRMFIACRKNGGTFNSGRQTIQTSDNDDADNDFRRYIANMRDFYADPQGTPMQVQFYWQYAHNSGATRNVEINNQKMTVIASYDPDFTETPTATSPTPRWIRYGDMRARYFRGEGISGSD